MRRYRNAIKALSLLTLTTFLTAIFAFAFQVVIARALSTEAYGALTTALATVSLLAPLAGFGIGKFWLRAFGLEGWSAFRWVRLSLQVVIVSALLVVLAALAWALFSTVDPLIRRLTLVLAPTVVMYPLVEMLNARFQLEENYAAMSWWQMLPNAARLATAFIALWVGLNVSQYSLLLFGALLVVSVALFARTFSMLTGRIDLAGHGPRPTERTAEPGTLPELLSQAWPFAASGVFYLIYFQSDVLLLGWMAGPVAAGVYNVAFTIMAAAFLLPSILHQKYLLPKIHRWAEHDAEKLLRVFHFGNTITLLGGVIVAALIYLLSPVFIPLLFGHDYSEAVSLLFILALLVPGRYLATSVGAVLVTGENMRRKVWLMGLTAAVNLAGNIVLIPHFGAYGAAVSTVFSEVVLLFAYMLAVRRYVFGPQAFSSWTLKPPS